MLRISRRRFLAGAAALVCSSGAAPADPGSSPQAATAAAARDAELSVLRDVKKEAAGKGGDPDTPYLRYLWVPLDGKEREEFIAAFVFHLNLLSDQGDLSFPALVRPDLLRIDIRDYGWDRRAFVWEKLIRIDPFFHSKLKLLEDAELLRAWPGGKDDRAADQGVYKRGLHETVFRKGRSVDIAALWLPARDIDCLRHALFTEAPIVNAEWFFVQSARQISLRNKEEGVGYYDWLGLKKLDDLYKLVGLDEKVAIARFQEWRGVVEKSGVSQQNRQVLALRGATGRVWITLDTFAEEGRGVAKRNIRRGEFAFDALEIYAYLPNGLFVTFLANNKGEVQAFAPPEIGGDTSSLNVSRDPRIHSNLSCLRCHGPDKDFLKPVDEWVRRTFVKDGVFLLQDPDKKTLLELRRQYMSDLGRMLKRDQEDYVDATARATRSRENPAGLSPAKVTRFYGEAWNRYVEAPVTLRKAARELGVGPEAFLRRLKLYHQAEGGIDLVLQAFLDGKPVTRLEWESTYALAQTVTLGLLPPKIPKLVKPK